MAAVSGIILAGGYSSRMKRNKAELPFHGKMLIEHQAEKLLSAGISDIMVAGYNNRPIERARYVADVYPHRGPLSGIHAGLLSAENAAAFVIGVDMPLIPISLIAELIGAHEKGATIVSHGGKREPLIGVYSRSLCETCGYVLRGHDTSVGRLLNMVPVYTLPYAGDERLLAGCNTPEEYGDLLG